MVPERGHRDDHTRLLVRIGAFELPQQTVAALDGEIERRLRRPLAAEDLLEPFVDHAADQDERAEPDSLRVLGRRIQRDLLDRNGRARIAVVKSLRPGQIERGARDWQVAGVLVQAA